jgi:hypothetical protein
MIWGNIFLNYVSEPHRDKTPFIQLASFNLFFELTYSISGVLKITNFVNRKFELNMIHPVDIFFMQNKKIAVQEPVILCG